VPSPFDFEHVRAYPSVSRVGKRGETKRGKNPPIITLLNTVINSDARKPVCYILMANEFLLKGKRDSGGKEKGKRAWEVDLLRSGLRTLTFHVRGHFLNFKATNEKKGGGKRKRKEKKRGGRRLSGRLFVTPSVLPRIKRKGEKVSKEGEEGKPKVQHFEC